LIYLPSLEVKTKHRPNIAGHCAVVCARLVKFAPTAQVVEMTEENEHAGAGNQRWEFSPWELTLALVPYRIGTKSVPARTGFNGSDVADEFGKPVPITRGDADEIERKRVYEALLELPGLEREIRFAVLSVLGRSQRDENQEYELGRTLAWRHMVDEAVARMRANDERPTEGFRTAAITEVAMGADIEPKTLQQRFYRLPKNAG
jgi:hypothetical protein